MLTMFRNNKYGITLLKDFGSDFFVLLKFFAVGFMVLFCWVAGFSGFAFFGFGGFGCYWV